MSSKKKTSWLFRLKTQFISAIGVSLVIAIIITTIILTLIGSLFDAYYDEKVGLDYERLNEAYDDIERLVEGNSVTADDFEMIYEVLNAYSEFDFSLSASERSEGEGRLKVDLNVYNDIDSNLDTRYFENDHALFVVTATSSGKNLAVAFIFIAILILFVLVFVSCISFFVGRKQNYLIEIDEGLEMLAGGDLDHRIRIGGKDEITSVAKNINAMSQALKEKIDQEKAIEATKNELIANISHDLRTPLTSITGFLTLLKGIEDKNSDSAGEYVDVALNKSTEMSKLIEQLFDYVMLSNNQSKLQFEEVDMSRMMKQSFFENKYILEEDGFIVHEEIDTTPALAQVDTGRFMRVINNLIQNIRKYANKSMVIEMKTDIDGNVYRIHLINGLKDGEDIDRDVFTRYFTSNRTDQKSVGLGLAICREIILHHQGTITAKVEGRWFEIIIELPLIENLQV